MRAFMCFGVMRDEASGRCVHRKISIGMGEAPGLPAGWRGLVVPVRSARGRSAPIIFRNSFRPSFSLRCIPYRRGFPASFCSPFILRYIHGGSICGPLNSQLVRKASGGRLYQPLKRLMTWNILPMFTGFARCAFIPASLDSTISSSNALADSAMMGTVPASGRFRLRITREAS